MVTERLRNIEQRIANACMRAGRPPEGVSLIAVTKTLGPDIINEAIAAGLTDIGENRVQEYLGKRETLRPHRLHMIGHLQKNKVRHIIDFVNLIHSVDSVSLAREIDKRAGAAGKVCDILLEVNTSGEESKYGLDAGNIVETALQMKDLQHVCIRGLMTVAEYCENPEDVRPSFILLRKLKDEVAAVLPNAPVTELSMGMTNDFEIAVEEGATFIRVGTALFGSRNYN